MLSFTNRRQEVTAAALRTSELSSSRYGRAQVRTNSFKTWPINSEQRQQREEIVDTAEVKATQSIQCQCDYFRTFVDPIDLHR
jgi:hypothetical protein